MNVTLLEPVGFDFTGLETREQVRIWLHVVWISNVLKTVLEQFFAGIARNFAEPVVDGEKAATHVDFRDADRRQIIGGV